MILSQHRPLKLNGELNPGRKRSFFHGKVKLSNSLLSILLISVSFGCTDVIDIDADFKEAELVVDAWLTQESAPQTILLSLTQNYFQASAPPPVTNATVVLANDTQGEVFNFIHKGDGVYEWTPADGMNIGQIGDVFSLTVSYNSWTYFSASTLNPTPPVDSIVYEFREAEFGNPEGIYAQFYARDLVGMGDSYWIKTYKNGLFLNKASEMNLSFDGTFDAGSAADAIVFIPPIREAINRIPDPDTEDNNEVAPYALGDSIRVEIHSITNEAHRFLTIAREQMTNGDAGLFALPVTNSPTNITALEADAPAALGFFCVSSISGKEILVE